MAQFGMYRADRDRAECGGRPGGSARPRLRRLLCGRCLHGRPADQSQTARGTRQVRAAGCPPIGPGWPACRSPIAITAMSGLILGSPTLRLRGDYLAIVTLGFGEIVRLLADNLDRDHRWRSRSGPGRLPAIRGHRGIPAGGLLGRQRRQDPELRRLVVLAVDRVDHHRAVVRREPRAVQGRPGLGGDPGGRGRGRDHGRADLQVQALGFRHRRHASAACPARCTPGRCSSWCRRTSMWSTRCCSCVRWCSAGRAINSASSSGRSSSCTCRTSSWAERRSSAFR